MEEQDGDRLDVLGLDLLGNGLELAPRRTADDGAVGHGARFGLIDQVALDQGLFLLDREVVGVGQARPPDLKDAAVPFGNHQGHLGPFALNDGVDQKRGAVNDQLDVLGLDAGKFHQRRQAALDRFGRVRRNAWLLVAGELAGRHVGQHEIGKRATDVNSYPTPMFRHFSVSFPFSTDARNGPRPIIFRRPRPTPAVQAAPTEKPARFATILRWTSP